MTSPPPSKKPKRARRAQGESLARASKAGAAESAAGSRAHRQVITDARAMRALAHPLRVALLEVMGRDGEITATQAAELLDESPGNMSWHLQTLAKYGFVEETGEGRGRRRPWRVTSNRHSFETGTADPETVAAGEALERTVFERIYNEVREWWSRGREYPAKWRRASFATVTIRYLTAEELASVMDEIGAINDRYADRDDQEKRPAGALPVRLYAHGHPLPPTASGN